MMETHPYALRMQQEFIRDVEPANPEYLVIVNVNMSWPRKPSSPTLLFDWYPSFAAERYTSVGVADIRPDQTIYRWGPGRGFLPPAVLGHRDHLPAEGR